MRKFGEWGLVDGSRGLGKLCAQTVFRYGYKAVGVCTQFPQSLYNFFTNYLVVHKNDNVSPALVRPHTTGFYTGKFRDLYLLFTGLYPLSTLPITTTTIYIIRRGTAQ